jgi:hypothetical protein
MMRFFCVWYMQIKSTFLLRLHLHPLLISFDMEWWAGRTAESFQIQIVQSAVWFLFIREPFDMTIFAIEFAFNCLLLMVFAYENQVGIHQRRYWIQPVDWRWLSQIPLTVGLALGVLCPCVLVSGRTGHVRGWAGGVDVSRMK